MLLYNSNDLVLTFKKAIPLYFYIDFFRTVYSIAFQKEVDKLYKFRDHFVENHGIEKAAQKTEEVSKLMKDTLQALETHKGIVTIFSSIILVSF